MMVVWIVGVCNLCLIAIGTLHLLMLQSRALRWPGFLKCHDFCSFRPAPRCSPAKFWQVNNHRRRHELTMNQSKTTPFRSRNLKGLVFLSPDKESRSTSLKTPTSLRPSFLGDNGAWSFPSVSSLSEYSIWRSWGLRLGSLSPNTIIA